MDKPKSTARYVYDVARSLRASADRVARERGALHGVDQPSYPRAKKSRIKPKKVSEGSGLDPRDNGEETELDLVAEIEGTGVRRSRVSIPKGPGIGSGAAPVRGANESRLSYLKRWKLWKLAQQKG